jgi:hypothetical protein
MAKPKQKAVKTPKKRSTKYGKLAAVCSKELAAKKTALVRAEKALAKAQQSHTELLAEVARLDMLDRSLKALINGTEPPQNVRYVYSYPQWVWYNNPYGWYWNGNTWTVNLGTPQTSVYYGSLNSGSLNTVTSGNTMLSNANSGAVTLNCSSNLSGLNSAVLNSSGSSSPAWQAVTTTTAGSQPEFTVDLSTGAMEDEPKADAKAEVEGPVAAEVGHEG